jgi:hypothetical protein
MNVMAPAATPAVSAGPTLRHHGWVAAAARDAVATMDGIWPLDTAVTIGPEGVVREIDLGNLVVHGRVQQPRREPRPRRAGERTPS